MSELIGHVVEITLQSESLGHYNFTNAGYEIEQFSIPMELKIEGMVDQVDGDKLVIQMHPETARKLYDAGLFGKCDCEACKTT